MALPQPLRAAIVEGLSDLSAGNGLAVWTLLNEDQRRAFAAGWLILHADLAIANSRADATGVIEGICAGMDMMAKRVDVRLVPMDGVQ